MINIENFKQGLTDETLDAMLVSELKVFYEGTFDDTFIYETNAEAMGIRVSAKTLLEYVMVKSEFEAYVKQIEEKYVG